MKKTLLLLIFLLCSQKIIFSQNKADYSEIITQVCKLYEEEYVLIYNNLVNDLYEYELSLLYKDKNNPKSDILKSVNISFMELRNLCRRTDKKEISKFYSTQTSKNLKAKNIALIAIPIISEDGNSAIIHGRYSCGLFCGTVTSFYFKRQDSTWNLIETKTIE